MGVNSRLFHARTYMNPRTHTITIDTKNGCMKKKKTCTYKNTCSPLQSLVYVRPLELKTWMGGLYHLASATRYIALDANATYILPVW